MCDHRHDLRKHGLRAEFFRACPQAAAAVHRGPISFSPGFFITEMGSPVSIDSSTALLPSVTTPSTGTLSPGCIGQVKIGPEASTAACSAARPTGNVVSVCACTCGCAMFGMVARVLWRAHESFLFTNGTMWRLPTHWLDKPIINAGLCARHRAGAHGHHA